jgi:hypothetical protein
MKVYNYTSTANVKSITFDLYAYSGNPDIYVDTPIGSRFASWYSRKPGNDWIVIQSSDRQLTDSKGMKRNFSFGVYGASREKSRFRLSVIVEKKTKKTAKRQDLKELAGSNSSEDLEEIKRDDIEENMISWSFGAAIGATFIAVYCLWRRYPKADHYISLD